MSHGFSSNLTKQNPYLARNMGSVKYFNCRTDQTEVDIPPELDAEFKKQAKLEYAYWKANIPTEWTADIRNDGKMLALYDQSQKEWNRMTAYPINRQEIMHFYSVGSRRGEIRVDLEHKLDLYSLLEGQEVLSFGFDDFNDSEELITVQAKDLYLYTIDYAKSELMRKIQRPQNIVARSIFYYLLEGTIR